jgi:hypothetical protein
MSLIILSDDGNFKAIVRENNDGSCAVFYGNLRGWRKLSFQIYRLPFHAALDEAHAVVQKLVKFPSIKI